MLAFVFQTLSRRNRNSIRTSGTRSSSFLCCAGQGVADGCEGRGELGPDRRDSADDHDRDDSRLPEPADCKNIAITLFSIWALILSTAQLTERKK
jgi:hypothetical protein